MNRELVDLYSDYLLSSFGATTATGLSDLLEGALSHDQITRFLSQQRFDSKTLWQLVKPMVRAIEDDAGVLIFDDTIQEKPHTDENELISWHFDHSKNRTVKGINLLNCVYHAQGTTLPVLLHGAALDRAGPCRGDLGSAGGAARPGAAVPDDHGHVAFGLRDGRDRGGSAARRGTRLPGGRGQLRRARPRRRNHGHRRYRRAHVRLARDAGAALAARGETPRRTETGEAPG